MNAVDHGKDVTRECRQPERIPLAPLTRRYRAGKSKRLWTCGTSSNNNFQNTYVTRFRHKSLALCLVRFLVTNAITEDLLVMFPDALVITSAIKKQLGKQQVEQHGIKWVMRIK